MDKLQALKLLDHDRKYSREGWLDLVALEAAIEADYHYVRMEGKEYKIEDRGNGIFFVKPTDGKFIPCGSFTLENIRHRIAGDSA